MGHHETAAAIHQAIESKDINLLIREIASHENDYLQEVGKIYVLDHGKALSEAVKSVAHGEFGALLIDLIMPRALFAARTIHNAISGAGTDEKAIIDVVVHITNTQIGELKEAYANVFQRDLLSQIKGDVSGNFGKVIANILEGNRSESLGNPLTEAENLYKRGEGKWGTDDDYFVHFFTHNSFESLVAINDAYISKYGHSLEVAIKKETSGSYEDILIALSVSRPVYWARRIRHAIAGLGTNDHLLRRAFALNNRVQLQHIQAVYESVNKGKTLHSDVAGDTSDNYKVLFLALLE